MKCPKCGKAVSEDMQFCPYCGSKTNEVSGKLHSVWPEWTIEKEIGRGSYGKVYRAVRRDNGVESLAAIKMISVPSNPSELETLHAEGLDDAGSRTYLKGIVDDFVREIQVMETLKGIQNIVSVEDYKVIEKTDTIGWDIYIRMELLTPFKEYISQKSIGESLTPEEVIKLGCDICTALEICERRNIIHRDIKPENIFINGFDHFKLGDFGVARKLENLTSGLSQKGTFNYMAPEVATGGRYDATIDVYSLGIVLYRYMNRNRLPFDNLEKQVLSYTEKKEALERRIRGERFPAPCDASPALAQVILRACEPNAADRFATATEMKAALERAKRGIMDETIEVRPLPQTDIEQKDDRPPTETTKKTKSKAPWVIAIISVALIVSLLVGVVVYAILGLIPGPDPEPSLDYPTYSAQYLEKTIASSHLNETKAKIDHQAARVADGKIDTAWVEGVEGYGEKEYVKLSFTETCNVSGLKIWNGYHKDQELYNKNSRPARIKITLSDGSHYYHDMNDVMQAQRIPFSKPIATSSITITILSVYPGTEYKDTVISEIEPF